MMQAEHALRRETASSCSWVGISALTRGTSELVSAFRLRSMRVATA
jgi:hypothetical protein